MEAENGLYSLPSPPFNRLRKFFLHLYQVTDGFPQFLNSIWSLNLIKESSKPFLATLSSCLSWWLFQAKCLGQWWLWGCFLIFSHVLPYFRQCWLAPWESQLEERILEIDTAQHNSGRRNHLFGCMGCGNTVLFLTKSLFESAQMGWSTFLCYSPCLLF